MAEHKHPAQAGKVIVERVKLQSGVTAGDEGCKEHYDERDVLTEETDEVVSEFSDLGRMLIIGEAIATPRSKKPFRPR